MAVPNEIMNSTIKMIQLFAFYNPLQLNSKKYNIFLNTQVYVQNIVNMFCSHIETNVEGHSFSFFWITFLY